jgi:hypothetical protein
MAKAKSKTKTTTRPKKYDTEPIKFEGTFEDMVAISTTGAGAKKPDQKKKN